MINRIKCFLIAVVDFVKHGTFVQHLFVEETEEPVIIIATEDSFRVSNSFQHERGEMVYPNKNIISNITNHFNNSSVSIYSNVCCSTIS